VSGVSGLEALTYFRQHHRTVPVIVITGSIEQKIARQALDFDALRDLAVRAMRVAPRT